MVLIDHAPRTPSVREILKERGGRSVVYGAGFHGRDWTDFLVRTQTPPLCVADADPEKWGTEISGIPVLPPADAAKKYGGDSLFIVDLLAYAFLDWNAFTQTDLHRSLREAGCADIGYVPSHYSTLFRAKAELADLDIENPVIHTPFLRMPNFYLSDNGRLRETFCGEAVDFILAPLNETLFPFIEGPYEKYGVALREGDVVLDCGANLGFFSALAAARGCVVHAFEPLPMLHPYLAQTASLYEGRILIRRQATTERKERLRLFTHSINCGGATTIQSSAESADCVQVQGTDIDSYVREEGVDKVDFIKADIEGAERAMLRGAAETLRVHAPKLGICTYHLPDDPRVLENIIVTANPKYTVKHRYKKLYAWVE